MENGKTSAGRRFLNTILLLINIVLISWIVISWRNQNKRENPADTFLPIGNDSGGTVDASVNSVSDASGFDPSSEPVTSGAPEADGFSGNGTDSWILGSDGDGQTSASLNTAERPTVEELESWKQTIGYLPPDAGYITDFEVVSGSWKGFIQYDTAEEMANVTVSGSAASVTLTVDWYKIHYFGDGSWENEESMEDTALTGSFADGGMNVAGAGSIFFYAIFESGGLQYAYGQWTLPDGSMALVGLVRP